MNAPPAAARPADPNDRVRGWTAALLRTLDDAIAHLREVVFEADWAGLRARHASDDDALRASVARYEQGLADLFRFLRAAGLPSDPVAWSRRKADWRRAALEEGVELTLRTALGEALYAAEATPLGGHAAYRAWALALTDFLARRAAAAPAPPADAVARLGWAYELLAPLAEHADFHAALAAAARPDSVATAHNATLLAQPRDDLTLNAAVRWLAEEWPAA